MNSVQDTVTNPNSLIERFQRVRSRTEQLASVLSPEDQTVQSMPDASPTKWHRAHVTWFFETFILGELETNSQPFDSTFSYLFNSYYEAVGDRQPRGDRGLVTRPTASEIGDYRANVDKRIVEIIHATDQQSPQYSKMVSLLTLGLNHEEQHHELVLMDIKHMLWCSPLEPVYVEREHAVEPPASKLNWVDVVGGVVPIGCDSSDTKFSFDNENPRHDALVGDFRLADCLVTSGEWLEFMADGGYERSELWLSEGWHLSKANGWKAPEYWKPGRNGAWRIHTLAGTRPVDENEPACHISFYEADAYATWAGQRLPTEFEWEHAALTARSSTNNSVGNLLSDQPLQDLLHPQGPRSNLESSGHCNVATSETKNASIIHQLFGDCWEWTGSSYRPYPGFKIVDGAIGEYNGKFMINTMVLRGGSAFSPAGHVRATYRNFFHPHNRWHLSGVRLASDG